MFELPVFVFGGVGVGLFEEFPPPPPPPPQATSENNEIRINVIFFIFLSPYFLFVQ